MVGGVRVSAGDGTQHIHAQCLRADASACIRNVDGGDVALRGTQEPVGDTSRVEVPAGYRAIIENDGRLYGPDGTRRVKSGYRLCRSCSRNRQDGDQKDEKQQQVFHFASSPSKLGFGLLRVRLSVPLLLGRVDAPAVIYG